MKFCLEIAITTVAGGSSPNPLHGEPLIGLFLIALDHHTENSCWSFLNVLDKYQDFYSITIQFLFNSSITICFKLPNILKFQSFPKS